MNNTKLILLILLAGIIYKLIMTSGGNFLFNMDNGRDLVDIREMVELKIRLITASAGVDYKKEALPFDRLLITMTTREVKRASLILHFIYRQLPSEEIIAIG